MSLYSLSQKEEEVLESQQDFGKNLSFESVPDDLDDQVVSSSEIDFYEIESDISNIKNTFKLLNEIGSCSEESILVLERPASTEAGWKLGEEVSNIAVDYLINFGFEELPSKYLGKLELLHRVENYDETSFLDLDMVEDFFTDQGLDEEYFGEDFPEVRQRTLDEYWGNLGEEFWTDDELLSKGLALDVVKTLQGQALNKEDSDSFADQCRQYENFFSRISPARSQRLDDESEYTVVPVTSETGIKTLTYKTGSCLFPNEEILKADSAKEVWENHTYQEAFEMWSKDPGTLYHAIGKDDELRGYVRSFLMEDSNGKNFAGIDTIEVPKNRRT